MATVWPDRNVSLHDGKVPLSRLLAAPALDSLQLTFLPSVREVTALNDELLARHPDLELRLYRLPKDADVSALAGLSKLRRLKLEHELASADFLQAMTQLQRLHAGLKRGLAATRIGWPKSLRHLSLAADTIELDGVVTLRALCLAGKVPDLTFAKRCPSLASLSLDGGSTGDLKPLTGCKKLAHVRVNYQAKVTAEHLAPLAKIEALSFLQLHHLPRIEELSWLGKKPKHLELVAMKGLKRIDWPGLASLESLALLPPFGRLAALDVSLLPGLKKLRRVSVAPLIAKARGGRELLTAFPKGERAPFITDFRVQVARQLKLDSPYV